MWRTNSNPFSEQKLNNTKARMSLVSSSTLALFLLELAVANYQELIHTSRKSAA